MTCHDCGMDLVAKELLATDETRAAVAAFHEAQERAVDARVAEGSAPMEDAAPGRIDLVMGTMIVAACVASIVTSLWRGVDTWAPAFVARTVVTLGALGYGVTRLRHGLAARRAARYRAELSDRT